MIIPKISQLVAVIPDTYYTVQADIKKTGFVNNIEMGFEWFDASMNQVYLDVKNITDSITEEFKTYAFSAQSPSSAVFVRAYPVCQTFYYGLPSFLSPNVGEGDFNVEVCKPMFFDGMCSLRWHLFGTRDDEDCSLVLPRAPKFPFAMVAFTKLDHVSGEGYPTVRDIVSLSADANNYSSLSVGHDPLVLAGYRGIGGVGQHCDPGVTSWDATQLWKFALIEDTTVAKYYRTKTNVDSAETETNVTPIPAIEKYVNLNLDWFNGILSNVLIVEGNDYAEVEGYVEEVLNLPAHRVDGWASNHIDNVFFYQPLNGDLNIKILEGTYAKPVGKSLHITPGDTLSIPTEKTIRGEMSGLGMKLKFRDDFAGQKTLFYATSDEHYMHLYKGADDKIHFDLSTPYGVSSVATEVLEWTQDTWYSIILGWDEPADKIQLYRGLENFDMFDWIQQVFQADSKVDSDYIIGDSDDVLANSDDPLWILLAKIFPEKHENIEVGENFWVGSKEDSEWANIELDELWTWAYNPTEREVKQSVLKRGQMQF